MKILVADDDKVSQRLLQHLLKSWGHEPVLASDGLEALAVMDGEEPPKLILLDWEMPGMDGLEVCQRIRQADNPTPPYIIFVTAKDTLNEMVKGLDVGASDFVRKPFNREELRARIRVGERTIGLQDELNKARKQMEHLAMYDPLTEVFNRRAMLDTLPRELARVRREGKTLAVGIADIDHFKIINDKYGHPAGDAALKHFVGILQSCVRTSDTIGRWGGEEFLILAPMQTTGSNPIEQMTLFERIRSEVEAATLNHEGTLIKFTVSIGVTFGHGSEGLDNLLSTADIALYHAKEGGRNQIKARLVSEGGVSSVNEAGAGVIATSSSSYS